MRKDSTIRMMARMTLLVRPLTGYMILAVMMGVLGFLCAIFIPYLCAMLISHAAIKVPDFPFTGFFIALVILAILRGILHYGEQACNHYIAFKLLAILRDKVFKALRRLSPAKLEVRDKGNLIYLITSDIEALEVFYAHTISPVLIAIITCLILLKQFADMHIALLWIALAAYSFCGILIPIIITKIGKQQGTKTRKEFGELSSYTLESLRAMPDILQYGAGYQRLEHMKQQGDSLRSSQKDLKRYESISTILGNGAVSAFSFLMLLTGVYLYTRNEVSFTTVLMSTVLMMSSFGPVLALSNLSNNLLVTMASARRVLALLDEEEQVKDIHGKAQVQAGDIDVDGVTFAYEEEPILKDFNAYFEKGKITGILGKSGSGKSTLLKLIMRFWETDKGSVEINNQPLDNINTADLRSMQSFMTQDTVLFRDTILNNIAIAKRDASIQEIEEACRKASIHDFIMSLPKDYATPVTELGDSLSGGEKQRIGLARALLHDADCILLDEPTSNLDALNEAVILQSIQKQKDKMILLVSHRASCLKIADHKIYVENGRVS